MLYNLIPIINITLKTQLAPFLVGVKRPYFSFLEWSQTSIKIKHDCPVIYNHICIMKKIIEVELWISSEPKLTFSIEALSDVNSCQIFSLLNLIWIFMPDNLLLESNHIIIYEYNTFIILYTFCISTDCHMRQQIPNFRLFQAPSLYIYLQFLHKATI